MIVVSDTTPLRYLAVLGLLDILPKLFGQVHCPEIVLRECSHPRAPEVLRLWSLAPPDWLLVDASTEIAAGLLDILDEGEAAARTLAQRLPARLILIDDNNGRRCAQIRGLATAGTMNILVQAGIRGWIDYFATTETLRAKTNFRTTQEIIDAAWLAVQPA